MVAFRTIGSTVDADGTIIEPFYPLLVSAVAFFAAITAGVAYFVSVQRAEQRR